jgi:hypothetical protein
LSRLPRSPTEFLDQIEGPEIASGVQLQPQGKATRRAIPDGDQELDDLERPLKRPSTPAVPARIASDSPNSVPSPSANATKPPQRSRLEIFWDQVSIGKHVSEDSPPPAPAPPLYRKEHLSPSVSGELRKLLKAASAAKRLLLPCYIVIAVIFLTFAASLSIALW